MTAHLLPNEENIKRGEDDNFSLVHCFLLVNSYMISRNPLNCQSCVFGTLAHCVCTCALFSLQIGPAMEVLLLNFRRVGFSIGCKLPRPFGEVSFSVHVITSLI